MQALIPTRRDLQLAASDFSEGLMQWRLWALLAWQDIRQRYRRSTLGPFWLTLSMAINIGALSIVWSTLFKTDLTLFLPYIASSLIIWTLIVNVINEGCMVFINSAGYIKQMRQPHSLYVLWTLWRNILVFFHNIVIYPVVVLLLSVPIGAGALWLLLGLPVLVINLFWMMVLFGLMSTRFRDIPVIVQSVLTLLFFVTPIFWMKAQLAERGYIAELNPMTHLIEIVRAPLLGHAPPMLSLQVAIGLAAFGWLFTFIALARFRARIPYWL